MTVSATRRSSRAAVAGRRVRLLEARRPRRHLRPDVRRVHGRPARRRRPARAAGPTSARRSRSTSPRRSPAPRSQLRVPTRVACEACTGTGSERQDRQRRHLPDLQRRRQGAGAAGLLPGRAHLPDLRRRRPGDPQPCRVCHGAGTVQRERTLQVPIPAGVEDGTRIRLQRRGRGRRRRARRPAISMSMSRSGRTRSFQRDGANIFCRVPLRMTQAALGRRGRGAGDRRHPGQGEDPRRHPDRRSVPPARQGLLGAAQRRSAATCTSRSPSRRRST